MAAENDEYTKELLRRYGLPDTVAEGVSKETDVAAFDNPFLQSGLHEEKPRYDMSQSIPGAVVGGAAGYMSSGAGLNPLRPNAKAVSAGSAAPFVERALGIPAGDVAATYELMHPAPPTLSTAAKTVAENRMGVPTLGRMGVPTPDQTQRMLGGTTGDLGTTGRQRMGGFNEETQRLSRAQIQQEEIMHRLRQRGVISSADPIATAGPMTKTVSGIDIPVSAANQISTEEAAQAAARAAADTQKAEAAAQQAAALAAADTQKAEAAAQQAAARLKTAAPITGALTTLGRVATGAGVGFGALDAYNRAKNGDYYGAGISGAMTLGSVPFPLIASAIGLPLLWVHDNPEQAKAMYQKLLTPTALPEGAQYFP